MLLLITGLSLFFLVHLLPSTPSLKKRLVKGLGERPYKAVFSIFSLVGVVLIVIGKGDAEFVVVWHPPVLFSVFTKLILLPAMVLLVAAYLPSNIKKHTRHPMLWGVTLWAVGHLLVNGDMASIILFGSFLAYSLIDMASANARGAKLQIESKSLMSDIIVIVVGGGVYALVGLFHQNLFGVPIV